MVGLALPLVELVLQLEGLGLVNQYIDAFSVGLAVGETVFWIGLANGAN
jgi:hypothetical protein